MLKFASAEVIGETKRHLVTKQAVIDAAADYPTKVSTADALWDKKSTTIFAEIRAFLDTLCSGARRCHYCEDSAADEIEHIYPKKYYPERTFLWSNYLFACGPCNGSSKGDQWAVVLPNGAVEHLVRRRGDPVVVPPAGTPLFIDPRVDDPTAFMEFDPGTGYFVAYGNPGEPNYERAKYTLDVLGLNKRDYLSRARRNAYSSYVNSIVAFIEKKRGGADAGELARRSKEINEAPHRSIFVEIGRLSKADLLNAEFWREASELWAELSI